MEILFLSTNVRALSNNVVDVKRLTKTVPDCNDVRLGLALHTTVQVEVVMYICLCHAYILSYW
jgi:hypothetical protein